MAFEETDINNSKHASIKPFRCQDVVASPIVYASAKHQTSMQTQGRVRLLLVVGATSKVTYSALL